VKQVLLVDGRIEVREVPAPAPSPGRALVATAFSVISSGTEASVLASASRSVLERAAGHPAPLRRILEIVRDEGMRGVLRAATGGGGMGEFLELGYAASGTIRERDASFDLPVGSRVACAGSQCAHHAELLSVPRHLMAPVPERVSMEEAAFATLGAIALHGFRRSEARVGETVAVVGLGLVGLLGAQVARAAGCAVLGFDTAPDRVDLARAVGIGTVGSPGECDPEATTRAATSGHGADAVLVFAASTGTDPLDLALRLARKKARVVVIGDVPIRAERPLLYAKEIDLLMATSYGPGRHDPSYEEQGIDYPLPYVRWTEGRNLAAVLDLMARGDLDVKPLIDRILPVDRAQEAYERLKTPRRKPALLFRYAAHPDITRRVEIRRVARAAGTIGAAVVGPGRFMRDVFLPELLRGGGVRLRAVVAGTGVSARSAAERFGAGVAATDLEEALSDPEIRLVVIGTRHHLHAAQVVRALEAGKAVFVEKPLCLTREELERIGKAREASGGLLAVGFNRRYAPLVREMRDRLAALPPPRVIQVRVNAGGIPPDHWTQDPRTGGGRLRGEGCHFVDLIPHLAGSPIVAVTAIPAPVPGGAATPDNFSLALRLADGSLGGLVYTSLGDPSLGKERVEAHAASSSLVLDDYKDLATHTGGRTRRIARERDKGFRREVAALESALRGEPSELIGWEEIEAATRWTITAHEQLEAAS
jgi:predicted dehydrogenase/threonine dehydrogenase-like Zn-dependent dehydrogenase